MSDAPTIQEQCYGTCWAASNRIEDLERELAEAKASHFELLQSYGALKHRLIAHKAALEKCEKALSATWADLDHLNHWMPTPCRELYMEAKLGIARLKGVQ